MFAIFTHIVICSPCTIINMIWRISILFFRLAKLWDAVWKDNQIYLSNSNTVHATHFYSRLQEFCFVLVWMTFTIAIRKPEKWKIWGFKCDLVLMGKIMDRWNQANLIIHSHWESLIIKIKHWQLDVETLVHALWRQNYLTSKLWDGRMGLIIHLACKYW